MVELRRIARDEIELGVPIPWAVYDKAGRLLLNTGQTIRSARNLEVLVTNGIFAERATKFDQVRESPRLNAETAFDRMDSVKVSLWRLFEALKSDRNISDFVPRIGKLSKAVLDICGQDTDASIASLHLDYETPYCVIHHLQTALVCELVAKRLGIDADRRLCLISAALTHDISLLGVQDVLEKQQEPLTEAQRALVEIHPSESAMLLLELGVNDPEWIDTVMHHHERLDGSGYPDALPDNAIASPARMLAIADMYSAMTHDRPYRKAVMTQQAMREILMEQRNKADSFLTQAMIKELGVFPPGTLVRMKSGDLGMVHLRTDETSHPRIKVFERADGSPCDPTISCGSAWLGDPIVCMVDTEPYRKRLPGFRALWDRHASSP